MWAGDGLALAGWHDPGPQRVAFVVAHGFTGRATTPAMTRIRRALASLGGVVAVDLRGHGRSAGRSTLGADEVLDIDAAVRYARAVGYRRVVTLGFSMGASAVLRHAGLTGGVDAVASVSSPARWFVRDTAPMRRVHWLCETRPGRLVSAGLLGTRICDRWSEPPETPVAVVGRIAPVPLLIVHGELDGYFSVDHARALGARAPGAECWIEPGIGHAESGMTPVLVTRIGRWLAARAGTEVPAGRPASGTIDR